MSPDHGALFLLLDALIRKQRLDGLECEQQGHDLASKAFANAFDVDFRRVVSMGAVCRVCEKPVTASDSLSLMAFRSPTLLERAERDVVRELKQKLRAADRNRKDTNGTQA